MGGRRMMISQQTWCFSGPKGSVEFLLGKKEGRASKEERAGPKQRSMKDMIWSGKKIKSPFPWKKIWKKTGPLDSCGSKAKNAARKGGWPAQEGPYIPCQGAWDFS